MTYCALVALAVLGEAVTELTVKLTCPCTAPIKAMTISRTVAYPEN